MHEFSKASKKRVFFALALDYFFLSALLQLASNLFLPEAYGIDEFGVNFLICCLLELIILKVFHRNVGAWLLGIYQSRETDKKGKPKRVFIVESEILRRESWLTMLLAYFCFSSGCKALYRWTLYSADFPIFGFYLNNFAAASYNIFSALLYFVTSYFIYHVSKKSIFWVFLTSFLQLASVWQSRHLLGDSMVQAISYRRSLTGRATGKEEIEMIQAMVPEAFFLIAGLFIILFLSQARRLR
jgi:hypothetical protein